MSLVHSFILWSKLKKNVSAYFQCDPNDFIIYKLAITQFPWTRTHINISIESIPCQFSLFLEIEMKIANASNSSIVLSKRVTSLAPTDCDMMFGVIVDPFSHPVSIFCQCWINVTRLKLVCTVHNKPSNKISKWTSERDGKTEQTWKIMKWNHLNAHKLLDLLLPSTKYSKFFPDC